VILKNLRPGSCWRVHIGMTSGRVHSRSARRLADVAIGRRRVMIRLAVRRFLCASPGCARTTFAEQGRRAARVVCAAHRPARGHAGRGRPLAGRAGARLARASAPGVLFAGVAALMPLTGCLGTCACRPASPCGVPEVRLTCELRRWPGSSLSVPETLSWPLTWCLLPGPDRRVRHLAATGPYIQAL